MRRLLLDVNVVFDVLLDRRPFGIPTNGPIQYTHQPAHGPEITEGPRLRAGLSRRDAGEPASESRTRDSERPE